MCPSSIPRTHLAQEVSYTAALMACSTLDPSSTNVLMRSSISVFILNSKKRLWSILENNKYKLMLKQYASYDNQKYKQILNTKSTKSLAGGSSISLLLLLTFPNSSNTVFRWRVVRPVPRNHGPLLPHMQT